MAFEKGVQTFVHKLEEGSWAGKLRVVVFVVALGALALFLLFWRFKGLSSPEGMDQAQIAREIARGHGFSTKFIRPLQFAQFRENTGEFPAGTSIPDTFHGPLNPYVMAPFLWMARKSWDMDPESRWLIYPGDRIVAILGVVFFLLATLINYFTARRLFDQRLAVLGTGLTLICGMFWEISLAGVPLLLMMLLFSGVIHCFARILEAGNSGNSTILWALAIGVLFGFLLLANAISFFLLAGGVAFSSLLFQPRGRDAAIIATLALLIYSPWLFRNYAVAGNPAGIAAYSLLDQVKGSESEVMRSMNTDVAGTSLSDWKQKLQSELGDLLAGLYNMLGRGVVAPVFFVAMLHPFKRRETSTLRWGILLMLLGAVGGMALAGTDGQLSSNNLFVLFVPTMIFYGLAFLLVLWKRTGITIPAARAAFISFLFLVSALPLIASLITSGRIIQWPPYVPPYVAILNKWFGEDEIIASDQPWAVAWYGDRKSLWIPASPKVLVELSDYRQLKAPISALHLTPISGDQKFMSVLWQGEWKEWLPFIIRSPNLKDFPLRSVTGFMGGEIILLADSARWKKSMPPDDAVTEIETRAAGKIRPAPDSENP